MPCLSIGYTPGVLMQPTVRRFVTWASDQAACSMTLARRKENFVTLTSIDCRARSAHLGGARPVYFYDLVLRNQPHQPRVST